MQSALFWLCASFIMGIIAAARYFAPAAWLTAVIMAAAGIGALVLTIYKKRAVVPLLFLFFLLGMNVYSSARQEVNNLEAFLGHNVVAAGFVQEAETAGAGWSQFLFSVTEIEQNGSTRPVRGLVRVYMYRTVNGLEPGYGDRLLLRGDLRRPKSRRNPGGFDQAAYLESVGVGALLYVREPDAVVLPGQAGNEAVRLLRRLQERASMVLWRYLPPAEAGLAAGILLGDKKGVQDGTMEAYRLLGLAHLLAVSGLNVGYVAAFALFAAGFFGRRRRFVISPEFIACIFVLGYVFLTGGDPPVWRAALMFMIALGARKAGRDHDGLRALAAAALIMLYFRPLWLFSLSFQLSFLATAGIILLVPRLLPLLSRLPRLLAAPTAVTLAAQLSILPLQAGRFGLFSLLAIPLNLFCVPLVGAAMALGLLGVVFGLIYPPLAAPFLLAAYPIFFVLENVPAIMAQWPLTLAAYMVHPAVWLVYGAFLLLFAFRARLKPQAGKKVLAVLLCLNLVTFGSLYFAGPKQLAVTFLDVGQGLAVHIQTPAQLNILIDAGSGRRESGERVILPYIRQKRINRLDAFILTHPHEDHYGGMPSVAEELPVDRFIYNGETEDSEAYQNLYRVLKDQGTEFHPAAAGSRITLAPDLYIEVLSPPAERFRHTADDVNNNSLVMRLVYRDFSLLITGDAEEEAIRRLLEDYGPKSLAARVFQVSHHGSRSALNAPLLRNIAAEAAVIPVGRNPFGHPHTETLALLWEHGVEIYRTDLDGSITVISDGSTYLIQPYITRSLPVAN